MIKKGLKIESIVVILFWILYVVINREYKNYVAISGIVFFVSLAIFKFIHQRKKDKLNNSK